MKQCGQDGQSKGINKFDVPRVDFDVAGMVLHITAKLEKAVNIAGANVAR